MPKIVDHEERREEISDTVLQLIAKDGINGVTLRAVAEASNWSTGVIGHYFKNRHHLLIAALRRAAYLQAQHFKDARHRADSPIQQVTQLLTSVLPLDSRRIALTKIFLFFYAEGANDEMSREEISEYLQNWRRVMAKALARAVEAGEVDPFTDVELKALQLVAAADALAGHAVLDPSIMTIVQGRPEIVIEGLINTNLNLPV